MYKTLRAHPPTFWLLVLLLLPLLKYINKKTLIIGCDKKSFLRNKGFLFSRNFIAFFYRLEKQPINSVITKAKNFMI